jgi:SSS family solute:Na+ symporter
LKSANPLDFVIIAIYMLAMLGIGVAFMRFNKGASDYFRGGNRIPWLVAGLSSFMSGFSAWTFTGAAGIAYKEGLVVILMYVGNALSFLLGYFIFAHRWRRSRITTTMGYLTERFDEPTRQTFSITTVFFQFFMGGSSLYGLGLLVASTCGLPIEWTILVSGGIMLGYCMLAGHNSHALLSGVAGCRACEGGRTFGTLSCPARSNGFAPPARILWLGVCGCLGVDGQLRL